MHVLFVTPTYPPALDGGARYAHALASQLVRNGHGVTVLTTNALCEADLWQGTSSVAADIRDEERLRVLRCPVRGMLGGRRSLMAWRIAMVVLSSVSRGDTRLTEYMARRVPSAPDLERSLDALEAEPDVVHGFNLAWEWPMVAGWRWARQKGLPFVATPFMHLGEGVADRVRRNNAMVHQRRIVSDADGVLVLTQVEADGLLSLGVAENHISVIGCGLNARPPSVGQRDIEVLLDRHELPTPFIVFLGRLSRDKGALDAAEAVLSLQRHGTQACLALIGQPSPEFVRYHQGLTPEARRHVRSLGVVDEVTKHAILSASAMLVLPSRVESFGMAFLEAWSHWRPVIGARAGAIPGVITEGTDGLLVKAGDKRELAQAIGTLLSDKGLAHRLGRAGHSKVAAHHSWDKVYHRLAQAYGQVTEV